MELGVGMVKGILDVAQRQVKEVKLKNVSHRILYRNHVVYSTFICKNFSCFLSVSQCSKNKFDTQINFCDDWCNTKGIWGCGLATIIGSDPRNTDGVDYQCDCSGCNGCAGKKIESLKFYVSSSKLLLFMLNNHL